MLRTVSICLLPALGIACVQREVASVEPKPSGEERVDFPVEKNRKIDILFVIDNSYSMDSEQISLADNFPLMVAELEQVEGGLPSVHIGVISTDLGGGPYPNGCDDGAGDNGALQAVSREPGCTPPNGAFIEDVEDDSGNRVRNYTGSLGDAFRCIARLGVLGCGFEQPLEAMRRALNGSNPGNGEFLREEALLAVIFITDEDDCSTFDTMMFSNDSGPVLGPMHSFRCFEFGVTCDVADPRQLGPRQSCQAREDSPYMHGVQQYVEFLRGLKQWDQQIMVAGIVGAPTPIVVGYDEDGFLSLDFSCGALGEPAQAVPPIRLLQFLESFQQRTITSICNQDLAPALTEIAARMRDSLESSCVLGQLADIDPSTEGVQPDCVVSELRPGAEETRLPACDNSTDPAASSALPCYTMLPDVDACPSTATHLNVVVYHADSDVVPPDTRISARCLSATP